MSLHLKQSYLIAKTVIPECKVLFLCTDGPFSSQFIVILSAVPKDHNLCPIHVSILKLF